MIIYQGFNSSVPYNYDHRCYENFNYIPHLHRDFELLLVESGEVTVNAASECFTCREGEAALIAQNEVHSYSTEESSSVTVTVFSEDYVREFASLMRTRSVKTHKLILTSDDRKFIRESQGKGELDRLLTTAYLSLVAARFFAACTEEG